MADIFVSYARKDRGIATALATRLRSEGWDVWIDDRIRVGVRFEQDILDQIEAAKAVIVLWSPQSVRRDWVLREARLAHTSNKLLPAIIKKVDPDKLPSDLRGVEAADLVGWDFERLDDDRLKMLFESIRTLAPPRSGYAPDFLGVDCIVPLPEVQGPADQFDYVHFSVVMNPARRLAWCVAYNVDGSQFRKVWRQDRWRADPRWPRSLQPELGQFAAGSEWDRGHLVSPMTVSWGDENEASVANLQAFFLTNVSPQHARLNREWWFSLERWERQVAVAKGQTIGLSGPIFSSEDKPFRDVFEGQRGMVARNTFLIPRAYWKIVVAPSEMSAEGVELAAFVIDQFKLLDEGMTAALELERFKVTIEELQELTQLTFPTVLHSVPTLSYPTV